MATIIKHYPTVELYNKGKVQRDKITNQIIVVS